MRQIISKVYTLTVMNIKSSLLLFLLDKYLNPWPKIGLPYRHFHVSRCGSGTCKDVDHRH